MGVGRGPGRFIVAERALDPEHFEFRGWDGNSRTGTATRREDAE